MHLGPAVRRARLGQVTWRAEAEVRTPAYPSHPVRRNQGLQPLRREQASSTWRLSAGSYKQNASELSRCTPHRAPALRRVRKRLLSRTDDCLGRGNSFFLVPLFIFSPLRICASVIPKRFEKSATARALVPFIRVMK